MNLRITFSFGGTRLYNGVPTIKMAKKEFDKIEFKFIESIITDGN